MMAGGANTFFLIILISSLGISLGLSFLVIGEVMLTEFVGGWLLGCINTLLEKIFHRKFVYRGTAETYTAYWLMKAIKAVFFIGTIMLVIFLSPLNSKAFIVALFGAYFVFLGAQLWEVYESSIKPSGNSK